MRNLLLVLSFLSLAFGHNLWGQQTSTNLESKLFQDRSEIYFAFELPSAELLMELTRLISIDQVDYDSSIKIRAYANEREFNQFLALEIPFQILPHPGLNPNAVMSDFLQHKSSNSWDYYPTYAAYVAMMNDFELNFPDLCRVISIGTSVNGKELLYAKITNQLNDTFPKPRFNYTSTMHGDETTGFVLMLRLIDHLLNSYGTDSVLTHLMNTMEIWINPNANPDGTYYTSDNTVSGAVRYNANFVDLNRNYPDFNGGSNPDGNPWQPETIAMMEFADSIGFVLGANFHGGIEVVNYPWDSQPGLHTDDDWWVMISREYADTCQHYSPGSTNYMTALNNGITNGYAWYLVYGSRQDYMLYNNRCRELTLEISSTKNPPASSLPTFWEYNYESLINLIKQTNYGFNGIVTDSISGEPLYANVFILNHDMENSDVFTQMPYGKYYRPIIAGTYEVVFSSPGYQSKTIEVTTQDQDLFILDVQLSMVAPQVDFSFEYAGNCSNAVQFINNSNTNPANSTITWYFGDGTQSSEWAPGHNYQSNGLYNVSLSICNALGCDSLQLIGLISIELPIVPELDGTIVCLGEPTSLFADTENDLYWYYEATDTIPFVIANPYITEPVLADTILYLEMLVQAEPIFGAKEDNSGSGGYFNSNATHYLVFDCFAPVKLKTVKIFSNANGNRTIRLRDSAGNTIASQVVTVTDAGEQIVTLDFDIPVGVNLQLAGPTFPGFYRNNDAADLNYPYDIGGLISIKFSSANTAPTGFYYYFYDWEIQEEACRSFRKEILIEVEPEAPTASFQYEILGMNVNFNFDGSNGNQFLWDFGDGNSSMEINPNHQYANSGNYIVSLLVENTCGSDTYNQTLLIEPNNIGLFQNPAIDIYPNPGNSAYRIRLSNWPKYPTRLIILNSIGEEVQSMLVETHGLEQEIELNLTQKISGIYFLKIENEVFSKTQKIIVLP